MTYPSPNSSRQEYLGMLIPSLPRREHPESIPSFIRREHLESSIPKSNPPRKLNTCNDAFPFHFSPFYKLDPIHTLDQITPTALHGLQHPNPDPMSQPNSRKWATSLHQVTLPLMSTSSGPWRMLLLGSSSFELVTAYVQQLENSRLKLTQLEQELQRARQQGIFISSSGDQSHSVSGNGALVFDVEYARWLEDHNRQINELRTAVNSHASDNDLRVIVDGVMMHYDEIFKLKSAASKADVFHILSGMWKTPAERCFLWLGGFRSSELLKLLVSQLEPLTEQQLVGICNLQQSSQQAEDALSQGMEALQQSLAETLASGSLGPSGSSGNVANYMGQMAMAMGKLGTLENFLRQADNLRQQTLQQMHRILTTRQSARALLAISDYFSRLRALSSLWLARPRE